VKPRWYYNTNSTKGKIGMRCDVLCHNRDMNDCAYQAEPPDDAAPCQAGSCGWILNRPL
jgi:hypothetical protein